MLTRLASYLRQHHVSLVAVFLALGGGGAYAAGRAAAPSPQVRELRATLTNKSGNASRPIAGLNGVTLVGKSQRLPDGRTCTLVAKTSAAGQVNGFFVIQSSQGDKDFKTFGRALSKPGSQNVAVATLDAGAPDVSHRVEGNLTWHDGPRNHVVTGVFHVFPGTGSCVFQGTLTGAG